MEQSTVAVKNNRITFWRKVIRALDEAIPLYEDVNHFVSFGKIQKLREWAVGRCDFEGLTVLDAGVGLGDMSATAGRKSGLELVVGLDFSLDMLSKIEEKADSSHPRILPVRGVFEALPLRVEALDVVMCGFSLRDAINMHMAIMEICRVLREGGKLVVLDVGKPDNVFVRYVYGIFWKIVAPTIAWFVIRRRLRSNPWVWIAPTYNSLPVNSQLEEMLKNKFRSVNILERYSGCVILIKAEK